MIIMRGERKNAVRNTHYSVLLEKVVYCFVLFFVNQMKQVEGETLLI